MTDTFVTPNKRTIAYHLTEGKGPIIVFLCGFKSDMNGTKAVFLENWAQNSGRAFLRFDYSGHGKSSGDFEDGCIGDWFDDTTAMLDLIAKPVVLVGSSMGGWISLQIAQTMEWRVVGLVTIAAAPDFTEDGFWAGFDDAQKAELEAEGRVVVPSEYGDPYIITKRLIEEGRERCVLRKPLSLPFAVRFLQGTADTYVRTTTALKLFEHADGTDMRLTLVDKADHSFSDSACLELIVASIKEVLAAR